MLTNWLAWLRVLLSFQSFNNKEVDPQEMQEGLICFFYLDRIWVLKLKQEMFPSSLSSEVSKGDLMISIKINKAEARKTSCQIDKY
jgi:hypothetical protein